MILFVKFVVVILTFLILTDKSFALQAYGAYGLHPQGNRRVTGMGGAFVGLSDDVNGILYNPAGLVLQEGPIGLGGNLNFVSNSEVLSNIGDVSAGIPYQYLQFGAVFRFGSLALGLGVDSPYSTSGTYDVPVAGFTDHLALTLSIFNYDLALAYELSTAVSLGATFRYSNLLQKYGFSSTNPASTASNLDVNNYNLSLDFGISVHPSRDWGLGLAVSPQKTFSVDSAFNQIENTLWFRDVVIPPKVSVGGFYRVNPRLLLVADVDLFFPPGDTLAVGGQVLPQVQVVQLDNTPKIVPHGGLEFTAFSVSRWDIIVRSGTYFEPARMSGAQNRVHFTGGLEVKYWAVAPSASFDIADHFTNLSIGVSIKMGEITGEAPSPSQPAPTNQSTI